MSSAVEGRKNLNIGCSTSKIKHCINLDIDKRCNPDVVGSIYKLPFKANTFDYIHMGSVLEHVDFMVAMREVYRVGKHNCDVEIWMPHFSHGASVWGHLEHKRGGAFNMFSPGKEREYGLDFAVYERRLLMEGRKYPYEKGATRWRIPFSWIEWFINRHPNLFERLLYHYIGGCEGIYFRLTVKK